MRVFTYSEARQQFADVLNYAQTEGQVCITRRDGSVFNLSPAAPQKTKSPLDIQGLALGLSHEEMVSSVHEGRRTWV